MERNFTKFLLDYCYMNFLKFFDTLSSNSRNYGIKYNFFFQVLENISKIFDRYKIIFSFINLLSVCYIFFLNFIFLDTVFRYNCIHFTLTNLANSFYIIDHYDNKYDFIVTF